MVESAVEGLECAPCGRANLVNSASRVQGLAEPGTVVVGDTTRRASDAAIAYDDAGALERLGRVPVPEAVVD